MIKRIKYMVFSVILLFIFIGVNALTKDDVINLASSINTCSTDTKALVSGFKVTYTRILNERDVSDSDLNKIYNNINTVKSILNNYNACSKESISKLPKSVKDELYSLYKQTNKLITSSPKYIDKEQNNNKVVKNDDEVKVVIDSSTNQIKVYEGSSLIDVVGKEEKLNYVGLNKSIICFMLIIASILVFLIALRIKGKKNIFIVSFIYVFSFLLLGMIIFRNEISQVLDIIETMSINTNNIEKNIKVRNKKIISYPSYNSKYASIYINGKEDSIYFGDSNEILSKGIGHMTKSGLPGEGLTTILSGHNTGLFNELFDLVEDDKVTIETIYGKFTYEMKDRKIVDDSKVDVLYNDYDLILYTCYPNVSLYGNERLVIYLNLIDSKWLGDTNED